MNIAFWIIFNAGILVLLFIDLALLNRGGRVLSFKQALLGSAAWIGLAALFAMFIHFWLGPTKGLEFVTGYLLEESLSVDNLFFSSCYSITLKFRLNRKRRCFSGE